MRKKISTLIILTMVISLLLPSGFVSAAQITSDDIYQYTPGQIIVKFKMGQTPLDLSVLTAGQSFVGTLDFTGETREELYTTGLYEFSVPDLAKKSQRFINRIRFRLDTNPAATQIPFRIRNYGVVYVDVDGLEYEVDFYTAELLDFLNTQPEIEYANVDYSKESLIPIAPGANSSTQASPTGTLDTSELEVLGFNIKSNPLCTFAVNGTGLTGDVAITDNEDGQGDGQVNEYDRLAIQKMILSKMPVSPCADLDQDTIAGPGDYGAIGNMFNVLNKISIEITDNTTQEDPYSCVAGDYDYNMILNSQDLENIFQVLNQNQDYRFSADYNADGKIEVNDYLMMKVALTKAGGTVFYTPSNQESCSIPHGIMVLGDEVKIKENTAAVNYNQDIYANKLAWSDNESGKYKIYEYDFTNSQTKIIANNMSSQFQYRPAVSQDKIVWSDGRNSEVNIYRYDINTGLETQVGFDKPALSGQWLPDVDGNYIVWVEDIAGQNFSSQYVPAHSEVYLYDINTGLSGQLSPNLSGPTMPKVYGNNVIFTDFNPSSGKSDLYYHNINAQPGLSGQSIPLFTNLSGYASPDLYGTNVVWDLNSGVYFYDLNLSGQSKRLADYPYSRESQSNIYENYVVYTDTRMYNEDIFLYDLTTDRNYQVTTNLSNQFNPVIYDNKIVWQHVGGFADYNLSYRTFYIY
jgi:beta propeller repeat protein